MYCPRPAQTKKKVNTTVPGKKTVMAPPLRTESCNASSSTTTTDPNTGSSTTTNTSQVPVPGAQGPAGPAGTNGVDGKDGIGFKWQGVWTIGVEYKTASETYLFYDVVSYDGSTWIAVADNTSVSAVTPEHLPGESASWELVAQKGEGALPADTRDFITKLQDDVLDWWKNATITDIIQAGIGVAGVVIAGAVISEMFSADETGDGNADSRFTGSDGYLLTGYTAPDIKVVLAQLCEYGGIPYNVSELPDEACEITIGQNTSIRNVLSQLSLAYQFEMVDTAGVLRFVPRAVTSVKTLTANDLGFTTGSLVPSRYTGKRFQGIDLPRSVTLTYISPDSDYTNFTQVSQLPTYQDGQDVQLQVPVTLSHEKAKQISEISLIQSHIERTQYKFPVSYEHMELEPGDVIETPMGTIRISRLGEQNEGIIEIEGTDAGVAEGIDASSLSVSIPPASTNLPVAVGYSQAFWIDPPALGDHDVGTRMYAAIHGFNANRWPGATVYMSENGGASYESIGSATKEATVGIVNAIVPSADYLVWDNTTTISVILKTNTLASVSELDVLNGKNFALIGNEIIGFKTATLTAPMTYTLSGLLRGRRGTEQFVDEHVNDELFVLLDDAITRIPLTIADRTTTKKFKVVTNGSGLDKVDGLDVYVSSNDLRLWTVEGAKILKIGDDFQVSYGERCRYDNQLKDGAELTHDEDWAGYGIVVYDIDGTTVKKTYTTTSESWTYTLAMQTTDFGAGQAALKVGIVQMSKLGVPGYPVQVNT